MIETLVREEQIRIAADELLATCNKLVHEGNVRRIIIKDIENRTIAEFPLTAGVVGAVLFPPLAAIGAIAALAAHFTIVIERIDDGVGMD